MSKKNVVWVCRVGLLGTGVPSLRILFVLLRLLDPTRVIHWQVSVLVAWSIVRTVRDWLEPTGFAHIVSVFGLALAIFGALLIPVDLYNVGSLSDSMTGIVVDQNARQEVVEHGALIVVLYQVMGAE